MVDIIILNIKTFILIISLQGKKINFEFFLNNSIMKK